MFRFNAAMGIFDSAGYGEWMWYSLTIVVPLGITTGSPLSFGELSVPYATTFAAQGGSPLYTWSWSAGTGGLPPGLSLSTGGVLSGAPTAAGDFSFTVAVTDSAQTVATMKYTLGVEASSYTMSNVASPGTSYIKEYMLLVDEASRVGDDLYWAVRPMLAVSQGALWLMSTPCGKRGFFYEAWVNGGPEWERIEVPARECPRIAPEFLREERATMGDRLFRQEYGCEFTSTEDGVFDRDLVERAICEELEPMLV